jgi:simple sugar transport system ATP-binding protein
LVKMSGICKRFGPVVALNGADFNLMPGEVHGLAGENGAGKTTLMRVLFGLVRPDGGRLEIDRTVRVLRSPREALAAGINMVHQHLMLIPSLSVIENVILGAEPRRRIGIDINSARTRLAGLAENISFRRSLDTPVGDLPLGETQKVEIIRSLYHGARILILDEPTAALPPGESKELLAMIRKLSEDGLTVVLIDHNLSELVACCSSVTVLRRGRTADRFTGRRLNERNLLQSILGEGDVILPTSAGADRDRAEATLACPEHPGTAAVKLTGLTVRDPDDSPLEDVTLTIKRGEIHGLAGSDRSGSEALLKLLWGLLKATGGRLELGFGGPGREAMCYIPRDRRREGLIAEFSLWENLLLRSRKSCLRLGIFISRRRAGRACLEVLDRFGVRPRDLRTRAGHLSGGNQQRLLVGLSLHREPKLALASCPTRGLDRAGIEAVFSAFRALADNGRTVLLTSRDIQELQEKTDRITAFFQGSPVLSGRSDQLDPVDLGLAVATGVCRG